LVLAFPRKDFIIEGMTPKEEASKRVNFIELGGKRAHYTDATNVTDIELMRELLNQTVANVLTFEDKSALVLIDVSHSTFNTGYINEVKDGIRKVTPKIRASAYVGLGGFQQIILTGLAKVTKRNVKTFKTLDDARNWLTSQA